MGYSKEAERKQFFFTAGQEAFFEFVLRLLKPPFGGRVLDVGCGTGVLMSKIKKLGFNVIGVDVVPENLMVENCEVRKVDLNQEALPFENQSFDIVVCTEVIEHLLYPHFALREIRRVLKLDGYAIFSFPNEYHFIMRALVLLGKRLSNHEFDTLGHHYYPSISSCEELVKTEFVIEKELYNYRPNMFSFWPAMFARNVFFRVSSKRGKRL